MRPNENMSSTVQKAGPGVTDTVDPEVSQKEYVKHKESQRKLIKSTERETLTAMLYQMVLGRRFEEKCAEVYRMGKIGGFCHLYIGQEAIAVGSMMALETERYGHHRLSRSRAGDGQRHHARSRDGGALR